MKCPKCGVPGAYVGFNSVECRNSKCEHFVIDEEVVCPCCGIAGHVPEPNSSRKPIVPRPHPAPPSSEPPLYS